jgi:hypothetical protein
MFHFDRLGETNVTTALCWPSSSSSSRHTSLQWRFLLNTGRIEDDDGPRAESRILHESWQDANPTKTIKQPMESPTATKTPTSGIQIQNMEICKF